MFVAAAALAAAALLTENSSYIRLHTDKKTVESEEHFAVNVYAGAHVPANAVDIAIKFPDNKVEIVSIDTGESVITIWTEDPYVENNKVILRGGTFRKGFVGEHLIATINARANEFGQVEFSISDTELLAGDGQGTKIETSEIGDDSVTLVVVGEDGTIGGDVEVFFVTDIDGDGEVTLADVQRFMAAWFSREVFYDFNNDRRMNFIDFSIILADSFFR